MIVIARNAEEKLMEDLRLCFREMPSQRCFYMAFSKAGTPKDALFERFLRLLQDIPNSYSAQVYICGDRDVFILMQGFMQRQFAGFLQKLADDLDAPELAGLGEVFEVGVHRRRLETLCGAKVEAVEKVRAKEEAMRQKEAAQEITLDTLSQIDPDMLVNIGKKRAEREDIVVMVADDDQIARTLISNVIDKSYRYVYAKNGRDALYGFVEHAPDVLFLDIGMPDMNGHDVLESIFQVDPEAYVIMFSGRKDKANMMRALETGAQGFMGKPFTRDDLHQYIEKSPYVQVKKNREGNHASAAG